MTNQLPRDPFGRSMGDLARMRTAALKPPVQYYIVDKTYNSPKAAYRSQPFTDFAEAVRFAWFGAQNRQLTHRLVA